MLHTCIFNFYCMYSMERQELKCSHSKYLIFNYFRLESALSLNQNSFPYTFRFYVVLIALKERTIHVIFITANYHSQTT